MTLRVFISVFLWMVFAGCGGVDDRIRESGCDTNTSLIAISDAHSEVLCGCNQPANTRAHAPNQALSCTISNGQTVVFEYIGVTNSHQIQIKNSSNEVIATSLLSNKDRHYPAFGYQFSETGTFTFSDPFASISGTITVQ